MNIKPEIFKAYDIRGIYPEEINEEDAYLIAKALVKFLKAKNIVTARDMRPSSEPLYEAVLKGLKEMGVKIYDIGLATTPMYMYVINLEKADGGIVVTASHNPTKYNGLRMEGKGAISVGEGSGMEEIRDMVLSGEAEKIKPISLRYEIIKKDYSEEYADFLAAKFSPEDFYGLTIAIDAGNGMTGMILPEILKKLQINYYPLYFELDGNFPHHGPDPTKPENLRDLGDFVIERNADIGIAFDGDGDRVGFTDEKGEPIDMDFITSLLTEFFLKKHPSAKILYDITSSRIVRETIEKNGGKALICRPGHSFFRRLIREENAHFGCENSGHCMFKEFFSVEAAIMTMLYVLKLFNESGKKLGDLIKPLKKYFFSLEAINFPQREKFSAIIEKSKKEYSDGNLSYLDGISVEYQDWWFNLRLSNTEPLLRLNIEAKTQKLLEEKKKEILKIIS
jgi:phosphomannomutase